MKSWEHLWRGFGYFSEHEMLEDWNVHSSLGHKRIADLLNVSKSAVRDRLKLHGMLEEKGKDNDDKQVRSMQGGKGSGTEV